MSVGTVEQVEHDAASVVRHQPRAHGAWQFSYRNVRFRHAIARVDAAVYAITVENLTDDDLQMVVEIVDAVIKVIEVHVSRLGDGLRDSVDREYFRPIIERLEVARDGLTQGLAPDPAERPTHEQLLGRMADMLSQQPLNLPDRTSCAPSSIS
jgi:hypothetical protein